ncbi:MAG: flagellar basal body-associated FliL family protein [Erythrobacter sp.]
MAEEEQSASPTKKRGKFLTLALGTLLLLGVGAGGAYAAVATGLLGDSGDSGPDLPRYVKKGASDPYAFPGQGKSDDGPPVVHGEGGSEYRTAYYSFDDSFTSNLAGTGGLIQVDLAVSTKRDGRVLAWVMNHELAIRSAILAELAATHEQDVGSIEGKATLAKRLTAAINTVLEEREGFGGIEAVHFKGFLVQ